MTDQQTHRSLTVDASLEEEFAKAAAYTLSDEDIERARLLLGIDTASKHRELYSVATPDALRNWSLGTGDDNPLYTDESYGPATRWGSQIGHGPMVGHIKIPILCHREHMYPVAVCRVCVVETNPNTKLLPSCQYQVTDGIKFATQLSPMSSTPS